MSESSAGVTRSRKRRSTRVSEKLEAARRRNANQLADQQDREKQVDAALRRYFAAADRIAAAEEACKKKIDAYQRKIDELRRDTDIKVAGDRWEQACAALVMHQTGRRTVTQVAELIELPVKQTRPLLAEGRKGAETEAAERRSTSTDEPEPSTPIEATVDMAGTDAASASGSAGEGPRW